MLSFKGVFDGDKVRLIDKPTDKKKYKVIVTFVEEIGVDDEIREFASQTDGLDFWKVEDEDLYQDYLPNKKSKR
ncbi:hypothetical protein [Roseimarinus sediminis]|jgi:hypothetical protein|uniref:hypothetical protein n=1 Tax=Roseimarinus sediminis TaxID=1610899 RepID=UPI003D22BC7E